MTSIRYSSVPAESAVTLAPSRRCRRNRQRREESRRNRIDDKSRDSIYALPRLDCALKSPRRGSFSYLDAVVNRVIPYEIIPTSALRRIYIAFESRKVSFSFSSPFSGPDPATIPIPFSMLTSTLPMGPRVVSIGRDRGSMSHSPDYPSGEKTLSRDIQVNVPLSGPDPATIPIPFSMLSRDIQANVPFLESDAEMMRFMRSGKRSMFWADEDSDDDE